MSPKQVKRRRPVSANKVRREQSSRRTNFWQNLAFGIIVFLFLGLIGLTIWYGVRLEFLTITSVEVKGGETISHEEVRKVAEAELAGEYYRFVPKRFTWTYPEEEIQAKLKEVPRLKSASLELVDKNSLIISIEEYYPFALWCSDKEGRNCIFLDIEGYAFKQSPDLVGSSMLRYYDSNIEVKEKEKPFDAAFMSLTNRLAFLVIKDLGFGVSYIERVTNDEVHIYLNGGGVLKINTNQSVEETFNNLNSILSVKEFSHLDANNFQYIDLRFGNKVFVNEETLSDEVEDDNTAIASTPALDTIVREMRVEATSAVESGEDFVSESEEEENEE